VNLNGEWEFGAGREPVFDRRITIPFCPQSQLSGIGERWPGDVSWYRRRFDAPSGDRLLLHLGAVDYRATVWVNEVEVASHEGGHTPFTADVTDVARETGNELVVRAEDPLTDLTIPRGKQYWRGSSEGIFYTPTSGIWQTVWLEPLPARHVRALRVRPDLAAGMVEVEVDADGPARVITSLDGVEVGRSTGEKDVHRVALDRVEPWSPESPRLYRLAVRTDHDEVTSYFGLREVATRERCFLLNGEPYVQRLILDQGYFPGGLLTAGSDADLRRDIELAKRLGFNGARKHQKLEDPRWLYWADVLGFLVWEEMPSFHDYSARAERRLQAEWSDAVARDRDHASVVVWVPSNESFGLDGVDAKARGRLLLDLYELGHRLDTTRPVVSNDGWEHAVSDLCTLHDYGNPDDIARRYRSIDSTLDAGGRPRPPYLPGFGYRGEPVIVSEFGGLALTGSGGWGYGEALEPSRFVDAYRWLIEALMDPGPVEGFCYTQLTDIEQERNGLLTFDRRPKLDLEVLAPITRTPKRR
jgi:beta-galactosidase/beta-glucuronidase